MRIIIFYHFSLCMLSFFCTKKEKTLPKNLSHDTWGTIREQWIDRFGNNCFIVVVFLLSLFILIEHIFINQISFCLYFASDKLVLNIFNSLGIFLFDKLSFLSIGCINNVEGHLCVRLCVFVRLFFVIMTMKSNFKICHLIWPNKCSSQYLRTQKLAHHNDEEDNDD